MGIRLIPQIAVSQREQLNETMSTCRFAQRMMAVSVDARQNRVGLNSVHGNLFKLDPVMQQYLEACYMSKILKILCGRIE